MLHYESDKYALHLGDCVSVIAEMPDESVDSVITSPPYAEQRKTTYGGIPEKDYPDFTVSWMRELKRVLKPNGSIIINISPHVKNGGLSDYVLRTRLAVRDDGWKEVGEMIWHKPNGMPTGSRFKPRRSWESLLWYGKHGQPYSDAKANGRPYTGRMNVGTSSAAREGWSHSTVGGQSAPAVSRCPDVVSIHTREHVDGLRHPAKYPVALAEWCAKLITPQGGTVLDPFNGSGSTGVAALRNGWYYVGIDMVPEYVEGTQERLERVVNEQKPLV